MSRRRCRCSPWRAGEASRARLDSLREDPAPGHVGLIPRRSPGLVRGGNDYLNRAQYRVNGDSTMVKVASSPILHMIRWMVEDQRVRIALVRNCSIFKDKQDQAAPRCRLATPASGRHRARRLPFACSATTPTAEDAFQPRLSSSPGRRVRYAKYVGRMLASSVSVYRTALKTRVQAARDQVGGLVLQSDNYWCAG